MELKLQAQQGLSAPSTPAAQQPPPPPPALAAPGYKWVLVKEGQPAPEAPATSTTQQQQQLQGTVDGTAAAAPAAAPAGAAGTAGAAGEVEEDTTIRGMTLWGHGSGSGLALRSAASLRRLSSTAGAAGGDAQLAALQQALRELESTRDRWGWWAGLG